MAARGEVHVCFGCGRKDTEHRSQLCGSCRSGAVPKEKVPDPTLLVEDPTTPVREAEAGELQHLVETFPPKERAVCKALMHGQTARGIAKKTKRDRGTIRRMIARVRSRLRRAGYDACLDR